MSDVIVTLTENSLNVKNGLDPLAAERDWSHNVVSLKNTTTPTVTFEHASPPASAGSSATKGVATLVKTASATFQLDAVRRQGPHTVQPTVWSIDAGHASPVTVQTGGTLDLKLASRVRVSTWLSAGQALMGRIPKPTDKDPSHVNQTWQTIAFTGIDDVTFVATVWPKLDSKGVATEDFRFAPNFINFGVDAEAFLRDVLDLLHKQKVQVFASVFLDQGVPVSNQPQVSDGFVAYVKARAAAAAKAAGGTPTQTQLRAQFTTFSTNLVKFFDDKNLDIDGISFDLENGNIGAAQRPAMEALYLELAAALAVKGRYLAYAGPPSPPINPSMMPEQPFDLARNPNIIVRPMSYIVPREPVIRFALDPSKAALHPGQIQIGVGSTSAAIATEAKDVFARYRVGLIHFAVAGTGPIKDYAALDQALNPGLPPPGTLGQPLQGPLNPQRIAAMKTAGATWPPADYAADGVHKSQRG
jgi:hypothetical protein